MTETTLDDDPVRTMAYKRGFNNGLEEAAKIVDAVGYSGGLKNWQAAQMIRDMKVAP